MEIDASINVFMLDGYKEKDFQSSGKSGVLTTIESNYQKAQEGLDHLEVKIASVDSLRSALKTSVEKVNNNFQHLVAFYKQRGFKDFGMEGELRKSIHNVEKSDYPYDKVEMLMLRRHEKDFFLRRDMKYADEFEARIQNFKSTIASKDSTVQIYSDLSKYQRNFHKVVKIEQEIGLQENSGIRLELNAGLIAIKDSMTKLRSSIKDETQSYEARSSFMLLSFFVAQLVIGILLAIFYSDVITKAFKELNFAMSQLAKGHFPKNLEVKTNEEIGNTKRSFNLLIERLKSATHFAGELGGGNIKASYDERFMDDIMALSMRKMQERLLESSDRQEIINWTNRGSANIGDILKNTNLNLEEIGDQILAELVKYLNANQGVLFLMKVDESGDYLDRVSTYAYDKKRFANQRIEIGNGLIGQCALEKSIIQLTQVPGEYVKITSGLGAATPRYLILVPLVIHENLMGIIELASFQKMKPHEVEFLEKISENIAAILLNKKIYAENHLLLVEAKRREDEQSDQAEALRRYAEEIEAKNEFLERRIKELESDRLKQLTPMKDRSEMASINAFQ